MPSFLEKLVRRYKMIYPDGDNILPISSASNKEKCKDFDIDKVDLRYNNVSTIKADANQNKNKRREEVGLDCNV